MTWRWFWLEIGVDFLIGAVAVIVLVARQLACMQRQREIFNGALAILWELIAIAALVALGGVTLGNLPPAASTLANRAAPVAAGAMVVYLQQNQTTEPWLQPAAVVGVDARTGAVRWSRAFNNGASPYDGETDYVAHVFRIAPDVALAVTGNGGLYALWVTDGATLWKTPDAWLGSEDYATASDFPSDGTSVFHIVQNMLDNNVFTYQLVAQDAHTGAVRWQGVPAIPGFVPEQLALDGNMLFVWGASPDESAPALVALDKTTGALLWRRFYAGVTNTLIVLHGSIIAVAEGDSLAGAVFRESDGAPAQTWTATGSSDPYGYVPVFASDDSNLYALYTSDNSCVFCSGESRNHSTLFAFDLNTGKMRWRRESDTLGIETLIARGGVVYQGAQPWYGEAGLAYSQNDSVMFAYDGASGQLLWRDNHPTTHVSWNVLSDVAQQQEDTSLYLLGIQPESTINLKNCNIGVCQGLSWIYSVNPRTGVPWWRSNETAITWEQFKL